MRSMKLVPVLLAAGALIVAGCGDASTTEKGASSTAGNAVDRAFVADMVPHHQSAVQMATIANRRGQSTFVTQLAQNIVRTQNSEIASMRDADKTLAAAGVRKGSLGVPEHMMGMNGDVASLNTAKPFDRAFLRMMIPHHEGALVMAKAELAKGKDPKLKRLAQNIISGQQRELAAMRRHLGSSAPTSDHRAAGHSG